jgi:hypothetical protein
MWVVGDLIVRWRWRRWLIRDLVVQWSFVPLPTENIQVVFISVSLARSLLMFCL